MATIAVKKKTHYTNGFCSGVMNMFWEFANLKGARGHRKFKKENNFGKKNKWLLSNNFLLFI